MLQYDHPYPGMLTSPETTLMSLDGGQGLYNPPTSWGDYSSGIYAPSNDPYYAE